MTTSPRAEFSKSLFNSTHRLDVVAAIGEYGVDESFYVRQIQEKLEDEYGTPPSPVAREIQLFAEFDLIRQISEPQSEPGRIYYERTDSKLMDCLIGVADMAIQLVASPPAH
jgi:hypothetical protein